VVTTEIKSVVTELTSATRGLHLPWGKIEGVNKLHDVKTITADRHGVFTLYAINTMNLHEHRGTLNTYVY